MNILIVKGHPRANGHTHAIAETYIKSVNQLGHHTKTIDVYAKEYVLPYMDFVKDSLDAKDAKKIKTMQEMVLWADEIVFIHPVWWATMPAGMKNWMDAIFVPRFAYKYNEKGKAEPLLTGKIAKVFATAGSHAPYYHIPIVKEFTPLHITWRYALLGFCGIELIEMKVQDKMNTNSSCPPDGCFEAFLETVKKSASRH